jgi:hypothetical protein
LLINLFSNFSLYGVIHFPMVASRPSTEGQLAQLASGEASEFAAWSVEDKSENQLLLSDFQGQTRSWLMTNDIETEANDCTKLYIGSVVVPVSNKKNGRTAFGVCLQGANWLA